MRELFIRPRARLDVEEAAEWYEGRRDGLGLLFLEELDYVLKRIAASPFEFPQIDPGVRRALLKRFPYSVYSSASEERVEICRDCRRSSSEATPRDLEESLATAISNRLPPRAAAASKAAQQTPGCR